MKDILLAGLHTYCDGDNVCKYGRLCTRLILCQKKFIKAFGKQEQTKYNGANKGGLYIYIYTQHWSTRVLVEGW